MPLCLPLVSAYFLDLATLAGTGGMAPMELMRRGSRGSMAYGTRSTITGAAVERRFIVSPEGKRCVDERQGQGTKNIAEKSMCSIAHFCKAIEFF